MIIKIKIIKTYFKVIKMKSMKIKIKLEIILKEKKIELKN